MYVALARRVPPSRQQSNHQLALCHRTSTACVSIGPARLWVRMVIMRMVINASFWNRGAIPGLRRDGTYSDERFERLGVRLLGATSPRFEPLPA